MEPSKYQQGILNWVKNGEGNATCNAVAGSGKTSTLKLVSMLLKKEGYSPSEIKVIVFAKQNSIDLIEKFGSEWKQSIQTLHSIGFRILQLEIGKLRRDERVINYKYRRIAENKKLIPRKTKKRQYKGSLVEENSISKVEHFLTLIDLVRLKLSDLTIDSIKEICEHHQLEGIHDYWTVSKAIKSILVEGKRQARYEHKIDYTDMIWLPVEFELQKRRWFHTYQWVLVDECQDLNAAQLKLSVMLAGNKGRKLYVGDPCQPAGTKVLKVIKRPTERHNIKTEWVNIENLKVGDGVYSYSAKDGHFFTSCKVTGISQRYYKDELIVVKTESQLISKYTKNHHCIASFEPFRNHYCVYIMQLKMQFRVGMSKVSINESGETGPVARLRNEGADAIWILEFYESRDEAFIIEQAISGKFGLPQLVFSDTPIKTPKLLEKAWQFIGKNFERAAECLEYFGRDIRYPLFKKDRQWQQSLKRPMVVQASNLVNGCLMLPYKNNPHCYKKDWESITISREQYEGSVFSLDVEKYHTYVADGIVTHNCQAIFGFAGADNRSYQNIVEQTNAIELPLSICYRCPKNHIDLVNRVYPEIPIEPTENAIPGILESINSSDLWDEDHFAHLKIGDMVLSRKTAPLVSLCIRLIGKGIAAKVKGKDVGNQIKTELKEISQIIGFKYKEFPIFLEKYKKFKFEIYENLDNEEQLKETLSDKLKSLLTVYTSQPNATNIEDLCNYIDDLFTDEESPITLSTCHRAKGLQGKRIFIIKPDDLPMIWERQKQWQKKQEHNLLYVALTRSTESLYIVGKADWFKPKEDKKITLNTEDKENNEDKKIQKKEETLLSTTQQEISSEVNFEILDIKKDDDCMEVAEVMKLISDVFDYKKKVELLDLLTEAVNDEKKQKVYESLIKNAGRSDRSIASDCSVSAPFVGKVRKQMIKEGNIKLEEERIDKRGRKHKYIEKSDAKE